MCKDTTIILSNNRNWTGPTGPLPTTTTGTGGVVVVPTGRYR